MSDSLKKYPDYNGKRKPKLLIVDDEELIIDSIKMILGDNFEIVSASNGLEAIEMYEKHKPDVVLMDVMMPRMNGIEATKKILEIDPTAKILAISAYTEKKGKEIIEAGALDILPKPFKRSELRKFIMKYVEYDKKDHQKDQDGKKSNDPQSNNSKRETP